MGIQKNHPISIIKEIKKRLTLESLLSRYNVKQGSIQNTYHCPFHEDKNPSFSIKDDTWKCFTGCGSGDQISFIEKYESKDTKEAINIAASISGIYLNNLNEKNEINKKHLDYLLKRGINSDTAQRFNLKSKGDYILFPQKRDKEFVGYKGINIKNKKMYFEGTDTKSKLFPDYDFTDIQTIIFTAGEWDCLYLNQELSFNPSNNVKAVSNSTGEGNYPTDLKSILKEKFRGVSIKIIYDHDLAGKTGADKLAHELHDLNIPIEIYSFPKDKPKGYDISDFFNESKSLDELFTLEKTIYNPKEKTLINELNSMSILDDFTFKTPDSYIIDNKGINKIIFGFRGEKIENISALPVIITQQAINTDEDIVSLIINFKRDNQWKKVQVEREIICDTKKILTLCNSGFPVHSANAKKMIEYLNDFELTNLEYMKTVYLTHNNGWKEFKGLKAFGLGSNILGLEDIKANILFSPEQGFERFNKALHAHGSHDKWLKTIKPLLKNPKVALAVYASLSAPLLSLVDCSSFLLHYWGDSSMGKTTVIEIASSIWGNPSKETGGLVTSWNNTQVFVEKIATFFDDLPIFLDDSHLTDDKTVSNILYMLGNSTGRGRGTKTGGIKSNSSWRTVCFSTGEKQLTESTQHDGARARTIEISGTPFGRNEGKLVNETKADIRENYGHLGNMFVSELLNELKDPERIKELKEEYKGLREILSLNAKNEIADRVAGYFGVIWLAGSLLEKYLGLNLNVNESIEKCYLESISERQAEGDISTRALNDVISFAQANMKSFMGKSNDSIKEHFGIWKDAEYIAFYPYKLKEFLGKNGFSYNSILRSWSDRDWIKRSKEGYSYPFYYESTQYRMIVIKWESIFKEN